MRRFKHNLNVGILQHFVKQAKEPPPYRDGGWIGMEVRFLFLSQDFWPKQSVTKRVWRHSLTNTILEETRSCHPSKNSWWLPITLIKEFNSLPWAKRSHQTWRVTIALLSCSLVSLIFMIRFTRHSLSTGLLMNQLKYGLHTETFLHHPSQVIQLPPLGYKLHDDREQFPTLFLSSGLLHSSKVSFQHVLSDF